jgi:hypothetical protein
MPAAGAGPVFDLMLPEMANQEVLEQLHTHDPPAPPAWALPPRARNGIPALTLEVFDFLVKGLAIVSNRKNLPPAVAARVRKILRQFERTTKFNDLPPQALAPRLERQAFIDAEAARQ